MPFLDVGLEVRSLDVVPVNADIVELGQIYQTSNGHKLTSHDAHRATTVASRDPVLDPGETVGVGAGSGRASLVTKRALGLNVLLPDAGTVLRAHVRLAGLVGPIDEPISDMSY